MTDQVVSVVRFTTELCGFHQLGEVDVKLAQEQFGKSLVNYFTGRVPFGKEIRYTGLDNVPSKDEELGSAIVGSVTVYIGLPEGEDLDRVCNGYADKKYPYTEWEMHTAQSEAKRAEIRAERREYGKKLIGSLEDRKKSFLDSARKNRPTGATAGYAAASTPVIIADGENPEDDL